MFWIFRTSLKCHYGLHQVETCRHFNCATLKNLRLFNSHPWVPFAKNSGLIMWCFLNLSKWITGSYWGNYLLHFINNVVPGGTGKKKSLNFDSVHHNLSHAVTQHVTQGALNFIDACKKAKYSKKKLNATFIC